MIPVRLQLHNFMSYGPDVPALSLDGVHLACLCGENGHGKSAILDALTWVLWGKARSNHDDELTRIGATEMQVELDFDLGGTRYRALRRRVRRGRTGQSTLELQILDGEAVRPLTGNSIAETQQAINGLLHLDYETFVNSAYLRQGRADQFTLKSPAERKEVLAAILGLSFYDDLSERARAAARRCEVDRKGREDQIGRIDAELAHQEEYQQGLDALTETLSRLEAELGEVDARLELLRHRQRDLESKAAEAAAIQGQLQRHENALRQLEQDRAACRQRIASHRELLSRREEVEAGYAGWMEARQEEAAAGQRLAELLPLQSRRAELEQVLEGQRQRLLAEQRSAEEARKAMEGKLSQVPAWRGEAGRLRERLEHMASLEKERENSLELIRSSRTGIELLKSNNERIKTEGDGLREKLEMLESAGAACPLCGSELGEPGREDLRARLIQERSQRREEYGQNLAEIKQLEGRVNSTQAVLAELERGLEERGALQRRDGELQRLLEEAREAAEEAARQQARYQEATVRLEAGEYALAERQQLAEVQSQIEAIGYDPASHAQARQRAAVLASHEQLKAQLETAAQLLVSDEGALARLEADAQARQAEQQAGQERLQHLQTELAERPAVQQDLGVAQQQRQQRHQAWSEALDRRGRLQQLLDHCRQIAETRFHLEAERDQLAVDRAIYEELAYAYGKNGIQAMLIDSVLPELEDEANALLDRMTEGRMRVRFETQRMSRTKDQMIETLDIKISDEMGTRPYELYSGGEAFRANFGIRVALSKLLARRAGARLQTLIVDEGFGTQDAQGRERLVEAINSISQDFERILVITHIEELKDAFPVRIEVSKTAEGSQISVSRG